MRVVEEESIELEAPHLRHHKEQKMVIASCTRRRAQMWLEDVGWVVFSLFISVIRLDNGNNIIFATSSPLPGIRK
ncbi:glutamyl-tRNA reductase, partial [Escherichia coli]